MLSLGNSDLSFKKVLLVFMLFSYFLLVLRRRANFCFYDEDDYPDSSTCDTEIECNEACDGIWYSGIDESSITNAKYIPLSTFKT